MVVSVEPETPARKNHRAIPKYRRLVLRPLLDAAAAGAVFTLVSSAVICNHAKAGIIPAAFAGAEHASAPASVKAVAERAPLPIVQIATASSPADAVYRKTSVTAAWSLLGVAFSLMAALNLALLRHLKRAYAMPRRRFPLAK
ncbi:MAG TPA: hypothetical protein PKE16_15755 [Hyphomicrobium sp.]|nr:hypothetical protein [Hyphomicrobium sp.]